MSSPSGKCSCADIAEHVPSYRTRSQFNDPAADLDFIDDPTHHKHPQVVRDVEGWWGGLSEIMEARHTYIYDLYAVVVCQLTPSRVNITNREIHLPQTPYPVDGVAL